MAQLLAGWRPPIIWLHFLEHLVAESRAGEANLILASVAESGSNVAERSKILPDSPSQFHNLRQGAARAM